MVGILLFSSSLGLFHPLGSGGSLVFLLLGVHSWLLLHKEGGLNVRLGGNCFVGVNWLGCGLLIADSGA
jgi:hypothetical protein